MLLRMRRIGDFPAAVRLRYQINNQRRKREKRQKEREGLKTG